MRTKSVLIADVGGSWTRVAVSADGHVHDEPVTYAVGSAEELLDVLAKQSAGNPSLHTFVGGFAGSTGRSGSTVTMTNWEAGQEIHADSIRALGFETVILINDLEAATFGLLDLLAKEDSAKFHALAGPRARPKGNLTLVIPGTGLGSAGIIDLGDGHSPRWRVVASELQHTWASANDSVANEILAKLATSLDRRPSWEDCVSGRGLEQLYVLSGGEQAKSAQDVARAARMGEAPALLAINSYYAVLGRYSQVLALAFLSYGGMFVAGASTAKNLDLIPTSPFTEEFVDNSKMPGVLARIPLTLVDAELNLLGALRIASAECDGGATRNAFAVVAS